MFTEILERLSALETRNNLLEKENACLKEQIEELRAGTKDLLTDFDKLKQLDNEKIALLEKESACLKEQIEELKTREEVPQDTSGPLIIGCRYSNHDYFRPIPVFVPNRNVSNDFIYNLLQNPPRDLTLFVDQISLLTNVTKLYIHKDQYYQVKFIESCLVTDAWHTCENLATGEIRSIRKFLSKYSIEFNLYCS